MASLHSLRWLICHGAPSRRKSRTTALHSTWPSNPSRRDSRVTCLQSTWPIFPSKRDSHVIHVQSTWPSVPPRRKSHVICPQTTRELLYLPWSCRCISFHERLFSIHTSFWSAFRRSAPRLNGVGGIALRHLPGESCIVWRTGIEGRVGEGGANLSFISQDTAVVARGDALKGRPLQTLQVRQKSSELYPVEHRRSLPTRQKTIRASPTPYPLSLSPL